MIEGTFTVVGKTKYVTIRFHVTHWLQRLLLEGRYPEGTLVVGYLRGADNSKDYTGFAFAIPDDKGGYRLQVWKKIDEGKLAHQIWSARYLLRLDKEGLLNARYEYALRSGNCSRCGRKLTVPASIHRGMGPECAAKVQ